MREYCLNLRVRLVDENELEAEDLELVESAKMAVGGSYSPYSGFRVGAALRLEDGEIIRGSNQENAAYPVGCCAERTALFWCGANRPGEVVKAMCIAGASDGRFTSGITAPCGMCRQAMLEVEQKQGNPIKLLLYGTEGIHIVDCVKSLLPLGFGPDNLNGNGM